MKIEVNKEQLEILKYAILWYECNDKEEERIVDELETKLYNAQEQDLLRSFTNMGGLHYWITILRTFYTMSISQKGKSVSFYVP